jgi:hypothetical protein
MAYRGILAGKKFAFRMNTTTETFEIIDAGFFYFLLSVKKDMGCPFVAYQNGQSSNPLYPLKLFLFLSLRNESIIVH